MLETFWGAVTGGFFFWLIAFVAILALFANNKHGWSLAIFAVAAVLFLIIPNGYGFGYLLSFEFLKFAIGYVAIGCVWSFFRWLFSMLRIRNAARSIVRDEGWTQPLDDTQKEMLRKHMSDKFSFKHAKEHFPPHMSDYTDDLFLWSSLWPVDAFWFLLSVPTVRIWKWIYAITGGLLVRIRDSLFKEFM